MKILNAKELNEKLNIQPVTKQQLSNHGREMWVNTNNWKDKLKTGDILFIRMIRRDDDGIVQHESLMCFRYVTFEDYFRYGYSFESNFENHIRSKKESKYGMLITYDHNKKTFRCIFLSTFYRDSNMTTNLVGNETTVTEIKRPVGTIEQPIKSEFFIRDNIKNIDTVCIYKDKSLNEKLDIQPVSKERLRNAIVSPKNFLKTGDVIISEMRFGDTHTCVYISQSDYKLYNYKEILKFSEIPQAFLKEGIIVHYSSLEKRFKYTALINFNDNLENTKTSRTIALVLRNKNFNQPMTFGYLKNPNIHYADILFKREGGIITRVDEKLGIQPVMKDRLKKYSEKIKKPKNLLKTGYIIKGIDKNINELGIVYIYISKNDLEKYKYTFKIYIDSNSVKYMDEGIFLRYNDLKTNSFTSFIAVSSMDEDLDSEIFTATHILKDKNQPNKIDYDYLKTVTGKRELPTDTTTIWKRPQTMK